ncbi:MAG: DUF2693 domain-containing protein [Proteobacteria bacterium]|nr:DUF2693 domain-containing protein [Pseudomonadota bacterium]
MTTTDLSWYKTADEAEQKTFREWLRSHLVYGEMKVVFTKKDGSEREMKCTLKPELVVEYVKKTDKEKVVSEETCAVFDLEKQEWRSFRYDSIKQVCFDIV